jgi:hypothetical protein
MERYSLLHGTDVTGTYKQLGNSKGLASFLSQMGATDPGATAKLVQNQINGFVSLAGYEKDPVTDKPVAVRYAWADNPDDANLMNKEGLLASPFRTDEW